MWFVRYLPVAAIALVPMVSVATADVVVVRGNAVETVSTARGGGVTILKGTVEKAAKPARTVRPPLVGTAGDTFWHVNPRTGRVGACRLRGTGYVGERRVVCFGG